jgi:F0F1-type ATP synthase assembly protein I
MERKKPVNNLRQTKNFLYYSSLALQMIITMLVFVAAGYFIDKWLNWSFPVFTLVLTLVGVFGSLYTALRKL